MTTERSAGLTVRWLGHASVVLDLPARDEAGRARSVRVLTDPLLRRHAGLLRRRGAAPRREDWTGADVALVSHLHHDHAELGSLELLAGVPVVSAPANAHWLRAHGVAGVGVAEGTGWTVPGTDVRVVPVAAVHGDRPMPHRPNAAVGFVLVAGDLRVWFAGDTAPYAGMAHLTEVAGGPVDLALLPVGGWGPRLSGGHMDPVQAARVVATVGARWAVPVHWGTLHAPVSRHLPPGWMNAAGPAFAAAVQREDVACGVHVLAPGGAVTLPVGPRD
ncbi:MBL fold metallo-hydrolase [Cellulomonas sp. DKR-3]|uniref:MBL fold metallo-hydrolase n=1 Tax=Cellulomonas fulva TaxID=2835530 RepID=A0ABS5U352_9CELL|nr:MBL fold metallo-hydrolase [Cellulomonas fulva]MBT0995782.1 MBL fold metallo-hydrolase [Cellulomonas fulva]